MNINFNADEIFGIAEEIESNAVKFYRKAADIATEKATQKLLIGLADMEQGHVKIFKDMREQLTEKEKEPTAYDPNDEAAFYLQAMAEAHGSEGKISPTKELTGKESMKEILEIALNAEKESVVFYFGMRSFVPAPNGRDRVEKIINEEIGHINVLNKTLSKLK